MSPSLGRLLLTAIVALASSRAFAAEGDLTGRVQDRLGAPVSAAQMTLFDPQQVVVASTRTDAQGAFTFNRVPSGSYLLVAKAPGLEPARRAVAVGHEAGAVALVLEPAVRREEVTVSAHSGRVESADAVSQPVNVIDGDEIASRARAVVAQIANEEPGLHLQRTSPTIAGIFVRGLTGNKVNVFVDGQRYSTASARGGVNTFLDLIDPGVLETVEVLRGPSSAQYGSDAIGGSVQFLTRTVPLTSGGHELSGSQSAGFDSADGSFGGSLNASVAGPSWSLLGTGIGRRVNTLRAGGGTDSHNALRRFFDVDPAIVLPDGRLPDTAFTQYGGMLKFNWVPSSSDRVVASYTRSQQDGGRRYDQLLGGDGNLVADLRNLMLDRLSLKYERTKMGPLDGVTLGYSFTAQREERVNQGGNGNPRAAVNHEYEKERVHGFQGSGSKAWGRHAFLVGGDLYLEGMTAPSFGFNPVTQAVTPRRGRVPDGARYKSGGVFVQDVVEVVPDRLRLVGNLRWSGASYDQRAADSEIVAGVPFWPDDSQDFGSVTFRAGAVFTPTSAWTLSANVSRGFRAPHITDLGTVGLTGSGYEITPGALTGLDATIGTSAGADATSTGLPADDLRSERSLSYEAGVRFHQGRLSTQVSAFVNDVKGNIQKQALILPPGAVGLSLGDQVVVRQTAGGAVFVPVSTSPVLVNANFDNARIWGIEQAMDLSVARDLKISTTFTYLHAEDRRTHRPPNIEGGTPAADGWLLIRYRPLRARYWAEPYLHAAARQTHLSSLDLEDRRTGATRSQSSIAAFFNNGARARGLIGSGADGVAGNADDVLTATGETVAQIQSRVLGTESSAPLFRAIPGYAMFGIRGGFRLAAGHDLMWDVANIGDTNYRGISWGVDAPGFGVSIRYVGRF
jgi:hemoglobin/transferrin/lactoferrin receptor protein